MDISEKIKLLCVKRKTNITELSVKLGNSKQNLFNKLYRNDLKISDFEKIVNALDCELKIEIVDKNTKEVLV